MLSHLCNFSQLAPVSEAWASWNLSSLGLLVLSKAEKDEAYTLASIGTTSVHKPLHLGVHNRTMTPRLPAATTALVISCSCFILKIFSKSIVLVNESDCGALQPVTSLKMFCIEVPRLHVRENRMLLCRKAFCAKVPPQLFCQSAKKPVSQGHRAK